MQIRHLKHHQIDYKKWDSCISESKNELIYSFSWFLDIVSPEWEALVGDDYRYVMPLPVKRKFGLKYIVQPVLTQQLGIFSTEEIEKKVIDSFIRSIPYRSYEMNLNEQNLIDKSVKCVNLILDLNESLNLIEEKINTNTHRNIAKAQKNNLFVTWNLSSTDFLDYYFQTLVSYSKPNNKITRNLIQTCISRQSAILIGAYNREMELVSALCLLKSKNRFIYLLPVSNEKGKKSSAMFLIIYDIIKKFAGSDKKLDFEGSMIDGIAGFYKGFGASEVYYSVIKRFRPRILIGKL